MTAAKKAVAKKTTKVVAKRDAPPASETPAPEELKTITFMDREIRVHLPDFEQLVAWQYVLGKLEKVNQKDTTAEQVSTLLGRSWKVVNAIIADEADIEWLVDLRMEKLVTIDQAAVIVLDAAKAYGAEVPQNRAARRAKA